MFGQWYQISVANCKESFTNCATESNDVQSNVEHFVKLSQVLQEMLLWF